MNLNLPTVHVRSKDRILILEDEQSRENRCVSTDFLALNWEFFLARRTQAVLNVQNDSVPLETFLVMFLELVLVFPLK